jgi:hypothetical protein
MGLKRTELKRRSELKRGSELMRTSELKRNPEQARQWQERSQATAREKARDGPPDGAPLGQGLKRTPLLQGGSLTPVPLQRIAPDKSGDSPKARSAPKPRPALKARTAKKAERDARYKIVRDEYVAEHPVCEVPGCCNESSDVHHTRGNTGDLYFEKRWFKAVCRLCHGKIHAAVGTYRKWLEKIGFINTRHRGGDIDQD